MKPRNVLELMGLRSKPQRYGYDVQDHRLPNGEVVHFAAWSHPRAVGSDSRYAFHPELVEGYRRFLREGDFCIDIGAHVGDTTLPMGVAVGPTGCVLGLEPNPFVYHVLEKNARANRHVANIRTMMAAAGPEQGFLEFEYSDAGFCNGGRHEGIAAVRHGHAYKLSVFCLDLQAELRTCFADELPRLRFIKVDAEGYDLHVLRALTGLLDDHRPIVKAEVLRRTSPQYRDDLVELFRSRGYTVHQVVEEPFVPGPAIDRDRVPETHDIVCLPGD